MAYDDRYRVDRAYLNQFRNVAYNDPWFALGELLGQGYMKRYEDRGTRKALEKVQAQYGDGSAPSTNDMSQALDTVQNRYQQDAKNTLGLGGLSPQMDREKVQAKKTALGVQNPMGQAMFSMNPMNDPNAFQGESEFNKRMRAEAQQRQDEMNALKTIGAVPMTNYEAGNRILDQYAGNLEAVRDPQSGMVTGLTRNQGANELAQQAYNSRMANFNAKDEMANIVAQMEMDGRTPEQIARVKAVWGDKLQRMQDDAYKARANDIVSGLGNLQYDSPEYHQNIAELAKFDPTMAQVMGNYGRAMWDRSNKLADEDRAVQKNIDKYRIETDLMVERDNAVLENKVAQLVKLGYPEQTARRMLLVGNPSGGGGRRRSGGGSSGGSGGGKMPAHLSKFANLADQVKSAIRNKDNDTAADLQDQMQKMIYDPNFRAKVDNDDFNALLRVWSANETRRMTMLREQGLPVNDDYYRQVAAQAGIEFKE